MNNSIIQFQNLQRNK